MTISIKQHFTNIQAKTPGKNTCEMIVLHHTGDYSLQSVTNTAQGSRASFHFLVDTNGDIYKFGEETDILWHAGNSRWNGKTFVNAYAIGIEVRGEKQYTDIQRESVKNLMQYIIKKYNISYNNVVHHKDITLVGKPDIDDNFWNNKFNSWNQYKNFLFTNSIIWNGERPNDIATDTEIRIMLNRKIEKDDDFRTIRRAYIATFSDTVVSDGSRPFDIATDFEIATMFTRWVTKNPNAKNNTITRKQVVNALAKL